VNVDHIEGRLDALEVEVREIQTRIAELRGGQDAQAREMTGLGAKLDDVADGYRSGMARLEVALHKHEDVLLRVYERLSAIEVDVGSAKKWLSKIWPMLAALFAGAAGGRPIVDVLAKLLAGG
jgi:predicted  nucleic acid-binding Zn-ribbon protein